jgi:hypothetical protein
MAIPKVRAKKKVETKTEPELIDEGKADDVGDVTEEFKEKEAEAAESMAADGDASVHPEDDEFGGPVPHEDDVSETSIPVDEDPDAPTTVSEAVAETYPSHAPMTSSAITVITTRHFKGQSEETESENILVNKFVTTPASVSVNLGTTINLGDFQSARVGVTVTVPCYVEELEGAYEFAKEFAEAKIEQEVAEVQGEEGDSDPAGGAPAPTKTAPAASSTPAPTGSSGMAVID